MVEDEHLKYGKKFGTNKEKEGNRWQKEKKDKLALVLTVSPLKIGREQVSLIYTFPSNTESKSCCPGKIDSHLTLTIYKVVQWFKTFLPKQ